ncbi:hypothetical protein CRYUN_Cryun18bG0056200 [Craigia yunnanensis]
MPSKTKFFSQFLSFFFQFPIQEKSVLLSASPEVFVSDCLSSTMKKSGLFAASVAAASASASATAISVSSSPSCSNFNCNSNFQYSGEDKKELENSAIKKSASTEKFAPRFDGLRFIETLITAHR